MGRVGTPRARPGVARLSQRDHTTTAHHSTEGEGVVLQSQVRPLTLSLFQSFFPLVKAHRIARQAFNKQAIITLLERRHIFQNAQVTSNKLVHKKRHHFGKALKSCLS